MSNRYLTTALRRTLEKVIKEARVVAEEGAQDAIRRLGVADGTAPSYLNDTEKELRRRLRAHARALGDVFEKSAETQETKRLVEAAAYAHWHRMLFARFLAERGLLRNPEFDVAVTLDDCRELAEAEGLTDAWAIAELYSAAMLPAVFRIDDPVLTLDLDPVHTQKLQQLVTGLDAEVFQAEDSLGWTYQFWRAAEKDAVNKSGVKIGADELPAVTQLFTEPYMVRFLLHNTLGAWWAGKVLAADPALAQSAEDEDALRAACALSNYSFDMLRFVREGEDGPWRPAAGTFPGWPKEAKAVTMLDPCCGSGHFLTEALAILAALRQVEEHLSQADAVVAVLINNLHGLEIDGRCVQIAAFAVALTAWRIGSWQTLPLPQIAWVGAPPPLPKQEFIALANGDPDLAAGLAALFELFSQAPTMGSLIETRGGDLGDSWRLGNIEPLLGALIERAKRAEPEKIEGAIAARGMADAAEILGHGYTLQATNVPFLGRGKQEVNLANFLGRFFDVAKSDLATAMLFRMMKLAAKDGTLASVSPQNWLHQSSYEGFRNYLFKEVRFNQIAILGEHGFESSSAAGAFTSLCIFSCAAPDQRWNFSGMNVSALRNPTSKSEALINANIIGISNSQIKTSPKHRITISDNIDENTIRLEEVATALHGQAAGDNTYFNRFFWEITNFGKKWNLYQNPPNSSAFISGHDSVVLWESEDGAMAQLAESVKHLNHKAQQWRSGKPNWGRLGVAINLVRSKHCSIYTGEIYSQACCAIVPNDPGLLHALWCFAHSGELTKELKKIDPGLAASVKTVLAVPFDPDKWKAVASKQALSVDTYSISDDPTQWLFSGHPRQAAGGSALHVALARLAGYSWPAEAAHDMRLSDEARDWISRATALLAVDNDGLLGIPAVAGEKPLADRLRAYLAAAFDTDWSDTLERRLVTEADETLDKKVARDGSLEAWVRDRAFRQHCALFGQRPFLWHISDGLKDGFSVFVHYHRFDQANLRKLTYTLLGDWLARAKSENNALRYEKGRELQQILEKVLEGEKPYDIFVRWKSLAQQPLGWDPDIDDGVRQNIRPFIRAGVLTHDLSKILKDKDRGNDVASAPWYPVFNGERRNDHNTTLAEKRAAREAAAKRVEAAK